MANSDNVQRLIVYLTAAILALGSVALAVWVWTQPAVDGRDFALIFGFLGTAFGAASTFLFMGESRTAQTKSTLRSVEQGGALGLSMPTLDAPDGPQAFEAEYNPDGDVADAEDPNLVDPDVPAEHRA